MIHKTKGIILRTVKYGETSLVVTTFTELLGLQSYMVNGVRTASKKGGVKANVFQPAAILDLVAYHNGLTNLQRLREYKWASLFQHIFSDVRKNAVALFMIELIGKCLKEPEQHAELFYFMETALLDLDEGSEAVVANFPLFFSLHLAHFFGFRISGNFSEDNTYLDLEEGIFVADRPAHPNYLQDKEAEITARILKIRQPKELEEVALRGEFRRRLLSAYESYYGMHISGFGTLKTVPVLREILS